MKNLKNIVAALTLTATLSLTATVANAGLLLSDRAESDQCTVKEDTTKDYISGLLLSDFPQLSGLLLSDKSTIDCQNDQRDGLLLSD